MPAAIVAGIVTGGKINFFSPAPTNPHFNDPHAPKPPPLPSIPRHRRRFTSRPPPPPPNLKPIPKPSPKVTHSGTNFYKPIYRAGVLSTVGDRAVVVGDSGISYLLPDAPFEFQYSYSETPKVQPLAVREPAFLPFAPPTMPRPWTGKAPLKSKKEKAMKKQGKVRLVDVEEESDVEGGKTMEMVRRVDGLVQRAKDGRTREEIIGPRLTRSEVRTLLKPHLSSNRQVNIGRDGLTHNMLEMIHCHWRRHPICKVRCRGVPTVDMDNVCHHLEDKTWGKVILRVGGVVYLFCGRNYNPSTRPRFPVMLWKPAAPVYPKLIQEAPGGLTKAEADDLREKGRKLLPMCKLAKNGIYITLVKDVRDAFELSPLAKIDCRGLDRSDYKKIGAKLKDLVPCVLLSFDEEQILMWRGKEWKSRYRKPLSSSSGHHWEDRGGSLYQSDNAAGGSSMVSTSPKKEICSPRMLALWTHAVESKKAMLLDATALSPDALLEKVEEFHSASQAIEDPCAAQISPASDQGHSQKEEWDESDYDVDDDDDNGVDPFEDLRSPVPFGSIPLDIIARELDPR